MDFSFLVKIKVFAKISEQNYKNNNSLVFYLLVRQVGNVICHKNKGGNDEYISVSLSFSSISSHHIKANKIERTISASFFSLLLVKHRSMMSNKSRNLLKPKSASTNRVYSGVRNAENIIPKSGY